MIISNLIEFDLKTWFLCVLLKLRILIVFVTF
jgi:hypothetical protein